MTKSVYATLILAVAALILAVVLNPSPEQHRERITEVIAKRSPLAEVLGVGQICTVLKNELSFSRGR